VIVASVALAFSEYVVLSTVPNAYILTTPVELVPLAP
jgi:hypothetical protein